MLRQTLTGFELLVVDDGSTDDTLDQLKSIHDPRVRILRQPHMGLPATRNTGVTACRAPLVGFLDGDDLGGARACAAGRAAGMRRRGGRRGAGWWRPGRRGRWKAPSGRC